MNKFIALAFFALCATVAHGQIISTLPLGLYGGDSSSSSSSAAAAAAASSSASNSGLSKISSQWISPVAPLAAAPIAAAPIAAAPLPLNYPYGPYSPYIASSWGPVAPVPGVVQLV